MLEGSGWLLAEGYKHREEIRTTLEKFWTFFRGKKTRIAFTGHAGAGKTVLFDHLTGSAYKQGYTPPNQSLSEEMGKIATVGKRIKIITIPGEHSPARLDVLDELFTAKDTVDGIVHVVSNGFVDIRGQTEKEVLIRDRQLDTLEKFRESQRKAELADLAETCQIIRKSARVHQRPKWLLVAVAKVDLYYPELAAAEAYYSPASSSSPFASVLNELTLDVGRDNFRWRAAPVCCWLEDFIWNQNRASSTLKTPERDEYISNFIRTLQDLC